MENLKLQISDIETEFGIELRKNSTAIGIDSATKTGWCVAKCNCKYVEFNLGYFDVDTSKVTDKIVKRRITAQAVYDNLKGIIKKCDKIVIEDVFHGQNAHVTILLARIGGIAYSLAKHVGYSQDDILWFTACEARKNLGLKGNAKKKDLHIQVNELLGINIKQEDEMDALILAINGLKK